MSKESNLKDKFKLALLSTARAISDDYNIKIDKKNKSSKNIDFFEIDNLNDRYDFIKYRAEIDSKALKKKFSNCTFFIICGPGNNGGDGYFIGLGLSKLNFKVQFLDAIPEAKKSYL